MKISYIRELKRNYMMAEPEGEAKRSYEAAMISRNPIRGLLHMKIKYQDGRELYCYDITSRQPLSRILETHSMTEPEIRSLILQLYETISRMECYLLPDEGLVLEPDCVYLDPENFEAEFCFLPGEERNFPKQLNRFLQYLLQYADHRDKECVVLAYSLYQESIKENYGIEDLIRIIRGTSEKEKSRKPDIPEPSFRGREDTGIGMGKAQEPIRNSPEPEPKKKRREAEQKAEEKSDLPSGKRKGVWIWLLAEAAIMAVLLGGIWLFWGSRGLWKYRWLEAGIGGGMLLLPGFIAVARLLFSGEESEKESGQNHPEPESWRMTFWDEEKAEPEPILQNRKRPEPELKPEPNRRPKPEREAAKEEPFVREEYKTMLLADADSEEIHRLQSETSAAEDIVISYFPFVIGKNRDLADYALERETVSRFHIRLEKKEGQYFLTDLNSTNGTRVRGLLLNANETVALNPGDPVSIADLNYIWR